MGTFEDDFIITQEDLEGLRKSISNQDLPSAINTIKDYLKQQDLVEIIVGVTGDSRSGKSTFFNAFRSFQVFLYPKYKNVKVWDLPGIATTNFKANEYLRQVNFERYDFFIIVASDRFKECHTQLANEITRMGKKFYRVCINMDRKNSLDRDKPNFSSELPTFGIEDPVFLIPYHQLGKYDFNVLMQKIMKDHQKHKRQKFMLVLSIIIEINERKKKALEKNIKKVALLSAGVAAIPLPGLSIAADVAIIAAELSKYYSTFCLDDPSLQKLYETSGKTVEELKSLMKSPLRNGINHCSVSTLLGATSALISQGAVKFCLSFIPIVGSVVSGGISYYTVSYMLERALNEIAEDAREVTNVCFEV